jgi:hypothetical protein
MTIPAWLYGTTHKDWLFDGRRCTPEQWAELDWTKAYVDLGPSPAGNLGPVLARPAHRRRHGSSALPKAPEYKMAQRGATSCH